MNMHRRSLLRSTSTEVLRDAADGASLLDQVDDPSELRKLPRTALRPFADALRSEVIDIVSQTGGHLGAGLGVVELTVALHYAFDTPHDKLIWDVSHQCYPHKVLTGRRAAMRRVRKEGGPAGFTSRKESAFDPFGAAHSSTAISAALGFAAARDLRGDDQAIVAVVGDGAMSGGMAFEGLNNAGGTQRPLIVVLNDNNMSIAPPAGSLQHFLTDLREQLPDEEDRLAALEATHGLPSFADGPTLFDDLGVTYAGPFDGHNLDELVAVFKKAKDHRTGPLLIHVITEKGKGYEPAMKSGCKYHGVSSFDVETGVQNKSKGKAPSYTSVFANSLISAAEKDESVVAVTAAMPSGTGLDKFGEAFPDRCFDAGIAEQHAITFCAGLACEGFKPFAAIYSTFLQRAYDQIVHDVGIQQLPVRFMLDRAGMVGADGVTHQGSYDIAYLGCLPRFVLMAPSDEAELSHAVETARLIDDCPSAVRYPRGAATGVALPKNPTAFSLGKGRVLQEGDTIAVLSYGTRLQDALIAAEKLAEYGLSTTVADARFAKPIDDELVRDLVTNHALTVTLEEGSVGGFATQVMDSIARQKISVDTRRLAFMHLPDRFIEHADQTAQVAIAGLDYHAILDCVATRFPRSNLYRNGHASFYQDDDEAMGLIHQVAAH